MAEEEDMKNWYELVRSHPDKAEGVKAAVGCALKHVTEALFDIVARNEWRKIHGVHSSAQIAVSGWKVL
jgi:hypothetical protein